MNANLKVLHITNWYPNEWNTYEGIFVKEQFDIFNSITDTRIVNIQVRDSKSLFRIRHCKYNDKEEAYFLFTSISQYRILELLYSFLLLYVLYRKRVNRFDLLQIHVAYPLLVFYKVWKWFIKVPVLISEHWTAYHFNFNLKQGSGGYERIASIFHHGFPLITVSQALQDDIVRFAGVSTFKKYILPNVIDLNVFQFSDIALKKEDDDSLSFFAVNVWRRIKNPFPILEAFDEFSLGHQLKLFIGGYGELMPEMEEFVKSRSLQNNIIFLGKMNKGEIAARLNTVDAYLFSSDYETFSVACAQALCTGVPLIGPAIHAIAEYAGEKEAIYLRENTKEEWIRAIQKFMYDRNSFNRKEISERMHNRFSIQSFKEKYLAILDDVLRQTDT